LVSFQKGKPAWEMSTEEKFRVAEQKKTEGNELYKMGKYKRAVGKYKRAVSLFDSDTGLSNEEKDRAKTLTLPLFLNLAACNLKLKEYKDTIQNAKKARDNEPANVKAFFRRGSAYMGIDDYDNAREDFNRALELDKGNKDIQCELVRLNERVQLQDKKDHKIYANVLQRLSKEEKKQKQEELKKK